MRRTRSLLAAGLFAFVALAASYAASRGPESQAAVPETSYPQRAYAPIPCGIC